MHHNIIINSSSVGIAAGYGLDGRGWIPCRDKVFLFSIASGPALRPKSSPIQWVQSAISMGLKGPGREAEHSPPTSTEIKNGGAILQFLRMPSWHSY
jgi:hypothetical protein